MEVSIKSLCFKFNILFSCRPLKSHDFVVRLAVFSSISQSDDETGKSHDKQRHKLKRCNFLYNFIFGLLRWVLHQILCKSMVKLSQTKLPFCSVFIRLFAAVCWRHSLWPYVYSRHVPNYVTIIASLSHFDHIFNCWWTWWIFIRWRVWLIISRIQSYTFS